MKPPQFEWVRPKRLEDCLGLLAAWGDEAKVLAGGQSLVPLLNFRLAAPRLLIDINRLTALDGIRANDAQVVMGALTRHRSLISDPLLGRVSPILPIAARYIGHLAIRNRGTVGGSLVHADPAAELPAVMILLDATLVCASEARGEREVAAKDFFRGPFTTALQADELVTRVQVPTASEPAGYGFAELSPGAGNFATAGAACLVEAGPDATIAKIRAVAFSPSMQPVDLTESLHQLLGYGLDADLRAATADVTMLTGASRATRRQAHSVLAEALTRAQNDVQARLAVGTTARAPGRRTADEGNRGR